MTTEFQIISRLFEEFHNNGFNEAVKEGFLRTYTSRNSLLERVVQDLSYLSITGFGMEIIENPEVTIVEEVEDYLQDTQYKRGTAKILFGKEWLGDLSEREFQIMNTLEKPFDEGSDDFFMQQYIEMTNEHPNLDVFKRNADSAILHLEGTLQHQPLLPMLREYRVFLDSLP